MTFAPQALSTAIASCYLPLDGCLAQMPALPLAWLGAAELGELARLGDANRRTQWLAGRWLSKQLIGEETNVAALGDLQIVSRDDRRRGVKPEIWLGALRLDWSLSISHSDRGVLVALAATGETSVGVDLTVRVPASESFESAWFSAMERSRLAGDRQRRARTLWAIKEAVYKAANAGESWDPLNVEVTATAKGEFRCEYRGRELAELALAIEDIDGQVAVVASMPRAEFELAGQRTERNAFIDEAGTDTFGNVS